MTHSSVSFSAGYYILASIAMVIWILSAFLIVDPMRPKRVVAYNRYVDASLRKVPLYVYQILGFLYLLLVVLAIIGPFRDTLRAYSLVGIPIIFIVETVYLLRVVFPTPIPGDVLVDGETTTQFDNDELGIRYVAPSETSNVEESSDNDDGE